MSASRNLFAQTLVMGYGSEDLHASFWISKWRVPKNIDQDVYAAILCVDPNGLRVDEKGPIIYVLDDIQLKPGLSEKNGAFSAYLNDNANDLRTDMELLRASTKWIRDKDEFWVGFQRGPDPGGNEPHGAWDSTGGVDGEGGGRKWEMGGYICRRYYQYARDTSITAFLIGKCYMDVWGDQIFGTPTIPRNYTTPTDIGTIAQDVITDITVSQPSGYGYTVHPSYFDTVIGANWKKEFRQERSGDVMNDICNELGYEWRIDYRRRVLFYPRGFPPSPGASSPAYALKYGDNIQEIPEMVMGDTTEVITHAIVTDGSNVTMPPDIDGWCANFGLWPDLTNTVRGFSATSKPAPCHPISGIYADSTLIIDDEGHMALCFQSEKSPNFDLNLSVTAITGNPVGSVLHIDLREFRRVKFKFRHATWGSVGSSYYIQLFGSTGSLLDLYQYEFGLGATSPQLGSGASEHDTISDAEWSMIDLELPELDVDGNLVDTNGWVQVGAAIDLTDVGWPNLFIGCNEADPGVGPGQTLVGAVAAGDEHLAVLNPEYFAGVGSGQHLNFWTHSICELRKGVQSEEVRLTANGGTTEGMPAPTNLALLAPVLNVYALPNTTLNVKGGWTICFSQFRFERNLRLTDEKAGATPPYRYRMMISTEMDHLNEAQARANAVIEQETTSQLSVNVTVDGRPEYEIGQRARLYLGVNPFQNVPGVIDDIDYRLGEDLDFTIDLVIGLNAARAAAFNQLAMMAQQERHIRNVGLRKTQMVPR